MTVQPKSITAEELLRLPDDGFRYELVRGELRKMSPGGNKHGRIAAFLTILLGRHVLEHRLGAVYAAETGFRLSRNPDTVRAPDVGFVVQERLDELGEVEGYWPGAPDLAVEVVSPHDSYSDVEEKVLMWLSAGTRMVVVVDPRKRAVVVHRPDADTLILHEGETLDGGDVVPGWTLPVAELFA